MAVHAGSFDFILNTIPVAHDADSYMKLLKRDGTMVILGAIEAMKAVNGMTMILLRRSLVGLLIGGIPETQ
ncbi:Alcohol dehydrogenase [Liberibacter crescens BT-1]|uniref:Alcohol dehydrogenase n=1 Tax=Liberibacter crescens (strain BT-1) TaxID=1215343 RepID=L0EXD8_LIBCB|nr:alcohol dehydrogenase [Liberibacter crescens]AGA65333.1 Alcohol dehydrogenase [Liberibacter crescens BT-1]AMC13260.1 hypothetical protein RL73_06785 [Liberibacter crescens]